MKDVRLVLLHDELKAHDFLPKHDCAKVKMALL